MLCDVANKQHSYKRQLYAAESRQEQAASGISGRKPNGINVFRSTVIQFDKVEGLNEATRNAYRAKPIFHKVALNYMALVFQFGDVPLVQRFWKSPSKTTRVQRAMLF